MELTDAALLSRWAEQRDSDAFMELVLRHGGMVYATCKRILRNAADAEDVTQECFVELAQSSRRAIRTHAGWLHAVAAKRAAMRVRGDVRRRAREEAYAALRAPSAEPTWSDVWPHVDAAIGALPDDLRAVIVVRFLEGLTYEQAAHRLDLPVSTLQYRIQKGLERLRSVLARRGIVASGAALGTLLAANAAEAAILPEAVKASLGKTALSAGAATGVASGVTALLSKLAAVVVVGIAVAAVAIAARSRAAAPPASVVIADVPAGSVASLPSDEPSDAALAAESPPSMPVPAPPLVPESEDPAETVSTPNVSGTVIEAATGLPVPNMTFCVQERDVLKGQFEVRDMDEVTTDAEGFFAFSAPHTTTYRLHAMHVSLAFRRDEAVTIRRPNEPKQLVLNAYPGANVSGRVFDEETGRGIASALVATEAPHRTTTDAQGRYVLHGLSAGLHYVHACGLTTSVKVDAGTSTTSVDIAVDKLTDLRGRVVNWANEPIPDSDVRITYYRHILENFQCIETLRTGPNGAFMFHDVPVNSKVEQLTVSTDAAPYCPLVEDKVALWPATREIVLHPAPLLHGIVLDDSTGDPVADYEILSHGGSSKNYWMTASVYQHTGDTPGSFVRALELGANVVTARAEGYLDRREEVCVSHAGEEIALEFRLSRGAVVEGIVEDSDGYPVYGGFLSTDQPPRGRGNEVRSDENGGFRMTLEPGEHVVWAYAEGLGRASVPVRAVAGEPVTTRIVLGEGARISGHITRAGSPEYAVMRYAITGEDGAYASGEVTTYDGYYEICGLPEGLGLLTVRSRSAVGSRIIKVATVDAEPAIVDCAFPELNAALHVTVASDSGLLARPKVSAYATSEEGLDQYGFSGGEKGFIRDSLPAGPFTLLIEYNAGGFNVFHREEVQLQPGQVLEHEVRLPLSGTAIFGHVTLGTDGAAGSSGLEIGLLRGHLGVEEAAYADYHRVASLVAGAELNADGAYRFAGITDGEYTLVVTGTEEGASWYAVSNVDVREGKEQTVDLAIP